jgi:hypothetical protein
MSEGGCSVLAVESGRREARPEREGVSMLVLDIIALVVSAAALGFSGFAFSRQYGIQRRLAVIEEARREEEVGSRLRADLTAAFEGRPTSTGIARFLVLYNPGPAVAREVDFEIGAVDPSARGHPVDVLREGHSFPIPGLQPGQSYSVLAAPDMGTASTARVTLRWNDDTGTREEVLTLNVY